MAKMGRRERIAAVHYKYRAKKLYCTQNDNDCATCSLANYGRDCMNNRIIKRTYMGPVEPFELKHPRLAALRDNAVFVLALFGGMIVEGPSEQAFINKLLGDGIIKCPATGLYVLDSIGKFNMHRFMNLLTRLGIPHAVIHDDDNNKDEHAEVNQLIQDSKTALTFAIAPIAGNLEVLLDVPKPKSGHRKPQHLLYLHETGQIKQANLQAFCAVVGGCLPKPRKAQEPVAH
jgi:hypothetical protein